MGYPAIPDPKTFCSTVNQLGDEVHGFTGHNPTHEKIQDFPKIDSWARIEEVLQHCLNYVRGKKSEGT
jgi:hypothetical protein